MQLNRQLDPTRKIKLIIFDLGGVIINIDYKKTEDAFGKFGIKASNALYSKLHQTELFDDMETGKISAHEFRQGLRKHADVEMNDQQIDDAWCAMLLDLPAPRLELLTSVSQNYNSCLLSNTNEIHIREFNKYLHRTFDVPDITSFFNKVYYSHDIQMRKPHTEIFEYVLRDQGVDASETFFIDDSPQHIEGARKLGIQAYHLQAPETIIDLFTDDNSCM